jgi:hypothetical protein
MDTQPQIALPLSAQELRFVDAYISCRDIGKAAIEAGYPSKDGAWLYRRKAVHDEITRRSQPIEAELAKQIVKKRTIHVEMLDSNLKQVITIPRKILEATPSLATPKVNAIEMGYKRVGLLLDGNFVPDASSGPAPQEAPRIYRPAEQIILTHQITETRQVITQRPVQHTSPTIEAEPDDPWKSF